MPTLRLLPADTSNETHGDEVLDCCFSPDSKFVLSGGWDGSLRIWNAQTGKAMDKISVGTKPVTACAISSDGVEFLSGTLDGMLSRWDAITKRQNSTFLAHTRPIATIAFASNGRTMVTASWDRSMILWGAQGRDSKTLSGHADVVAGCCFTPDAHSLMSWSHDNTVRLWDVASTRSTANFKEFNDRVLCGAIAPEGRWGAIGSRDHSLKILDLVARKSFRSIKMAGEARCCHFLLDGKFLVAGDSNGKLVVFTVPELRQESELDTNLVIQCGALAPSGAQLALGCNDGRIHLVEIEGFDAAPLLINVSQHSKRTASVLQRMLGKSSEVFFIVGCCPVCRSIFEHPEIRVEQLACPACRRALRVAHVYPKGQEE